MQQIEARLAWQYLDDHMATRFLAAWLRLVHGAKSIQTFGAIAVLSEESRAGVKAIFLDYDGTLREFEAPCHHLMSEFTRGCDSHSGRPGQRMLFRASR